MADAVRLSIVYDTQQAASNLAGLNRQLGISTTSARKAGLGALMLAQSFESGSISAAGMASSLGRVSTFLLGPWGLAIAFAAAGLTFFMNRQQKTRDEARKFADQLRDTKRAVDELLIGRGKTAFESEVQHLSDLIVDLDRKIKDANSSWTTMMQGGLAAALMALAGVIPGAGALGKLLMPGPPPESAAAAAERRERERLLRAGPLAGISERAAFDQRNARNFARLMQGSEIDMMSNSLERARKELEDLIVAGIDSMSDRAKQMAASILQGEAALRKMTRAASVMRTGLQTMADAIEEFVTQGTFAFTDFLNNILRLLYRDFTGSIIDNIMRGVGRIPGSGSGGSGGVQVGGSFGGPGISGNLATNVTFNVQTIDAAGTAQWLNQNGAQIAAVVTGQAARTRAIRRTFQR